MERFAVIGLGRFGSRLAENLARSGAEVIAIDTNRQLVEEMRDKVTLAVAMDATDEQALRIQGLDKIDVAIVGIGQDFEANALATVTLKQLGVRKVISRAASEMRGRILTRIGADDVVYPEDESADRWSHRLMSPHVIQQIELAPGHSLAQIKTPKPWIGKSLMELGLRAKYMINVVAIKRPVAGTTETGGETFNQHVIDVPLPGSILQLDDVLIIVGQDEDIQQLPH